MKEIERRIAKLEIVRPQREFLSLVLNLLHEGGYEELIKMASSVKGTRFLLLNRR